MRIAPAGAALVLAVAVLTACSVTVEGTPSPAPAPGAATVPPGPESRAEVYIDGVEGFGLVPPAEWDIDTGVGGGIAVRFRKPVADPDPSGPFFANINVLVRAADADLATTVAEARRLLAERPPGYRAVEDEPAVLPGGVPAHRFGGTFTADGADVRNLQLLAVHDGRTVVVTCTALESTWPAYAGTFDASLRTLVVDP
jgi:hypothetical protein